MTASTAAMMAPGVLPAILRRARAGGGLIGAPLFAGEYVAVWLLAGLGVSAVYAPPSAPVAAALIAAGVVYELTPLKRACRRRCREELRSGVSFGAWCLGSSAGLMAVLVAIDPMNVPLMCAVGAVAFIQKELP